MYWLLGYHIILDLLYSNYVIHENCHRQWTLVVDIRFNALSLVERLIPFQPQCPLILTASTTIIVMLVNTHLVIIHIIFHRHTMNTSIIIISHELPHHCQNDSFIKTIINKVQYHIIIH